MAIEIEAKMRIDNVAALEARLEQVGAQRGPVIVENNCLYDRTDGSLRRAGNGLRVRIEKRVDRPEPVVILTHKGPRAPGPLKTRHETQLTVDNADAAKELLAVLGYAPVLSFEKLRRRWQLDDCLVELDTLPHLGDFVEIEGPSESRVLETRMKLNLHDHELIRKSYASLIGKYLAENQISSQSLVFQDAPGPLDQSSDG